MKCCLWLVFKVELIVVQRRAGQGQCQATHNKHIPGSFTCYASQETCFTQAAGLCGRMGRIFLLMCVQKKKKSCTKRDTNPSHPLTKPDTFAFVISLRSQTPNLFPFLLYSNSHSSLYPSPRHFSAFPPPASRAGGADVMRARGGWKGKSRHAKAPWGHWTDTAVLERRDISLALWQRPQPAWATNESQWHDFMFQRSCQKSQCMCVKDSVEMLGGWGALLRKSGSRKWQPKICYWLQ